MKITSENLVSLKKVVYQYTYSYIYAYVKTLLALKGGDGSGNFGHAGRPGLVGGSASSNGGVVVFGGGWDDNTFLDKVRQAAEKVELDNEIILKRYTGDRDIYGTASQFSGGIYLKESALSNMSIDFIAAVIKHETLHIINPELSEDDVRRLTSLWVTQNGLILPVHELEILNNFKE